MLCPFAKQDYICNIYLNNKCLRAMKRVKERKEAYSQKVDNDLLWSCIAALTLVFGVVGNIILH